MTPASSGDSSQYQCPLYQHDQSYLGNPAYLASPETTPMTLRGPGQGIFGPVIGWGDYQSGVHTPRNDLRHT